MVLLLWHSSSSSPLQSLLPLLNRNSRDAEHLLRGVLGAQALQHLHVWSEFAAPPYSAYIKDYYWHLAFGPSTRISYISGSFPEDTPRRRPPVTLWLISRGHASQATSNHLVRGNWSTMFMSLAFCAAQCPVVLSDAPEVSRSLRRPTTNRPRFLQLVVTRLFPVPVLSISHCP